MKVFFSSEISKPLQAFLISRWDMEQRMLFEMPIVISDREKFVPVNEASSDKVQYEVIHFRADKGYWYGAPSIFVTPANEHVIEFLKTYVHPERTNDDQKLALAIYDALLAQRDQKYSKIFVVHNRRGKDLQGVEVNGDINLEMLAAQLRYAGFGPKEKR